MNSKAESREFERGLNMSKCFFCVFIVAATFPCFAIAQNLSVNSIELKSVPPAAVQMQSPATQPNVAMTPEMEIDALKKKIVKLQDQNKQLTDQNKQLTDQNSKLSQQISEMTKKGGSQVKAYCESQSLSKNTAGATNSCASSGYNCEPVSGLCYNQCTSSDHCVPGWVCDTAERRCVNVSGR
jgi:membrane-associated HD superfamily phosphohydrolase